jgi:hypothetical protein
MTVNYTVGIQPEIARDTVLEANYIGSRSSHLPFASNYNYLPIEELSKGNLLLQPAASSAAAAAGLGLPFAGFENQRREHGIPVFTSVSAIHERYH